MSQRVDASDPGSSPSPGHSAEVVLIQRLRSGDEDAFLALVGEHHPAMLRMANSPVGGSLADEVVQEAWTRFLEALPRFEGRSSLRTWLYGILFNCMRSRARTEARSVPFSSLEGEEPPVDRVRFNPEGHHFAGHWIAPPPRFPSEDPAVASETRRVLREALEELPEPQRDVVMLRDVEGLSGAEVAEALGVTEGHQRVLLHRARARLRAALEAHFAEGGAP